MHTYIPIASHEGNGQGRYNPPGAPRALRSSQRGPGVTYASSPPPLVSEMWGEGRCAPQPNLDLKGRAGALCHTIWPRVGAFVPQMGDMPPHLHLVMGLEVCGGGTCYVVNPRASPTLTYREGWGRYATPHELRSGNSCVDGWALCYHSTGYWKKATILPPSPHRHDCRAHASWVTAGDPRARNLTSTVIITSISCITVSCYLTVIINIYIMNQQSQGQHRVIIVI